MVKHSLLLLPAPAPLPHYTCLPYASLCPPSSPWVGRITSARFFIPYALPPRTRWVLGGGRRRQRWQRHSMDGGRWRRRTHLATSCVLPYPVLGEVGWWQGRAGRTICSAASPLPFACLLLPLPHLPALERASLLGDGGDVGGLAENLVANSAAGNLRLG